MKRIQLIDILRGFALIGILFANIPSIARLSFTDSPNRHSPDRQIYDLGQFCFEQRFFPIFSLLFGLSFFIFMRNAERKNRSPYRLMLRRLSLLVGFGVIHQVVQPGEALLFYGVLGFGLLPFCKTRACLLVIAFISTLVLGIIVTEYSMIFAMFLLGMLMGKAEFFDRPNDFRKLTLYVWSASLILIAPAVFAQEKWHASTWTSLAGLTMATAMVTSLILWSGTGRWLRPLAAFGRMALTNYVMQSVIVFLIAMAFGGYKSLPRSATPIIWLSIWPLQIVISNLWLHRFNYGPLEWLWRWGTYGTMPVLRR